MRTWGRRGARVVSWGVGACLFGSLAIGAAPNALARQEADTSVETQSEQQEGPLAQLRDAQQEQGPFTLGDEQFTVLLDYKVLISPQAGGGNEESTLAQVQIVDSRQTVVYDESFPATAGAEHLEQNLTASAASAATSGGAALLIRFVELPPLTSAMPAAGNPASPASPNSTGKESWQMFGVVNGGLKSFGAVLPVGQGEGISVGGVVAGVMQKGGIGVEPLASTADVLELRAWTGYFYALVPLRVDWMRGEWGEGEECYRLAQGALQEKGCNMQVQATRRIPPADDGTAFVRLFAGTDADPYDVESVPVRGDSQVEFLETRAVAHWQASGEREECTFDDLWLHVRVDGKEGWVHTPDDFTVLGLPAGAPQ